MADGPSVAARATTAGHAGRVRPLPSSSIETAAGPPLKWNAGAVGYVKARATRAEITIQWRHVSRSAPAASLAQDNRFLTRWVTAWRGFPRQSRSARLSHLLGGLSGVARQCTPRDLFNSRWLARWQSCSLFGVVALDLKYDHVAGP